MFSLDARRMALSLSVLAAATLGCASGINLGINGDNLSKECRKAKNDNKKAEIAFRKVSAEFIHLLVESLALAGKPKAKLPKETSLDEAHGKFDKAYQKFKEASKAMKEACQEKYLNPCLEPAARINEAVEKLNELRNYYPLLQRQHLEGILLFTFKGELEDFFTSYLDAAENWENLNCAPKSVSMALPYDPYSEILSIDKKSIDILVKHFTRVPFPSLTFEQIQKMKKRHERLEKLQKQYEEKMRRMKPPAPLLPPNFRSPEIPEEIPEEIPAEIPAAHTLRMKGVVGYLKYYI